MTYHQTDPMVSSKDVDGTKVFSLTGEHIGDVDHLLIDKQSGHIAYAIMTFGGFLGLGESEYAIPWKKLNYDTDKKGYLTDITKDQLEGAPERTKDWSTNNTWRDSTYLHYGVPPYWM
ncbi:PRC-barrel domain-containing protein [Maritalea sp.]|uniref:PRC-barrel domain-containing protein n=1 Tax=Maritalea sp. TaxID=2003361 RepID=UPI003EF0C371